MRYLGIGWGLGVMKPIMFCKAYGTPQARPHQSHRDACPGRGTTGRGQAFPEARGGLACLAETLQDEMMEDRRSGVWAGPNYR